MPLRELRCNLLNAALAGSNGNDEVVSQILRCFDCYAIQSKEDHCRNSAKWFVPVHKRVITHKGFQKCRRFVVD